MKIFTIIIRIIIKGWYLAAITIIVIVHYFILNANPEHAEDINKFISSLTQIAGGLIVVCNINENFKLLKQNNIYMHFLNKMKRFLFFLKKNEQEPNMGCVCVDEQCDTIESEAYNGRQYKYLEERIEETQRQVDDLRGIIYRIEREIKENFKITGLNLDGLVREIQNEINELKGIVIQTTIGDIKAQIFGVLLVVYGAVLPILPLISKMI